MIIVQYLLGALILVMVLQAVLSWVPHTPDSPIYPVQNALSRLVNPIYAPVRKVIPPIRTGSGLGVDLTPMVVILVLMVMRAAL